jgi:hypothetical protein
MPIFNAMKEMNFKKWVIITVLLSLILPAIAAGINYFMDPLWCFSLSHRYNMKQDDFDERRQKTNYITFHDFNYQGLILGASTSTNINQRSFNGIKVYNYAINALTPPEYLHYLTYAKKRNCHDFEYVFLGLDFGMSAQFGELPFDAEKLFAETNSCLYRIKILLSIDTLKFSRKNFMNSRGVRHIYYDRNNIKHTTPLSPDRVALHMKYLLAHFEKSDSPYSFNNFVYNPDYRAILEKLKDENPRTRFVVFTTPMIMPMMASMVKNGLLDEYLRWISDIVEVFGECYHFMYPNAVCEDYMNNFHDPNHYNPQVSVMMVDAMFNKRITGDTAFGMYISRANLKQKLSQLERLMKEAAARDRGVTLPPGLKLPPDLNLLVP